VYPQAGCRRLWRNPGKLIEMARGGRTGRPYRRLRDGVIKGDVRCWICTFPIDAALDGRSSWGPSLHHVDPLVRGGDLMTGVPAHTGCNAAVRDSLPGSSRYVRAVAKRRALAMRSLTRASGEPVGSPSCNW